MKKQKGFTAVELFIVIGMIAAVVWLGVIIFVGHHFLSKIW